MRAVSLFSGAGGFEIGFDRAGIHTILQAESDPWCLSVLERHWPEVARVRDVREVDASTQLGGTRDVARAGRGTDAQQSRSASAELAVDVDLVYGGFPCQDVSVAGRRAGFGGERSSLWFEFERVLRELRPRWVVIENVPGLLSSNRGADFGRVLRGLGELGYGWAYRVLDARWFGVPQRRRRVFVVGCLGDARRTAQVLAVCESCGGHPAESGEAGEGVAFTLAGGSPATSRRIGNGWNTTYLEGGTGSLRGLGAGAGGRDSPDVPLTLPANGEVCPAPYERPTGFARSVASTLSGGAHANGVNLPGRHHEDDENLVVGSEVDPGMARSLNARATGYRMDLESENFVVAQDLRNGTESDTAMSLQSGGMGAQRGRSINSIPHVVAGTLNGGEVDDTAPSLVGGDGPHGRSTFNGMDVVVADPISAHEGKTWSHEGKNNFRMHNVVEVANGLRASDGHHGHSSPRGDGADNLVAWDDRNQAAQSEVYHTLRHAGLQRSDGVLNAGVRRLTPLECERLMGWPDEHTRYTADGKPIPDSHRYRLCGNGVVATVAEWIGHRLVAVDEMP